jgi:hypothetical protein
MEAKSVETDKMVTATKGLSKHVPSVMNKCAETEELLDDCDFYMAHILPKTANAVK